MCRTSDGDVAAYERKVHVSGAVVAPRPTKTHQDTDILGGLGRTRTCNQTIMSGGLGKLRCDDRHRLFSGAQAASRSEQRANVAESFIRRLVHNGNETLTGEERRKFFVGDAFFWEALQQCGGHQHDPDPRVRQALVDGTEQRHAEANVLLAEPDLDATGLKQIVQLLGGPLPVVPRMAKKYVPKVEGRLLLDVLADRRESPHLGLRVHHGRAGSRPSRPNAAARPAAAASASPAAPRRGVGRGGVGRGRVRTVAAVAATIAATACRAGRCSAR
jgi:hypothetical protein